MRKCKRLTFLGFSILQLFLLACNPTNISQREMSEYAEVLDTDLPQSMEIWEKAIIHIEGTTNIESVQQRIHATDDATDTFQKKRNRGTALFLKHQNRHYLITSRYVVHDAEQAHYQMLKIENEISHAWSQELRTGRLREARENADASIYNILFKVPTLKEFTNESSQAKIEFIIGLGAESLQTAPYSFSEPETDLALISLDRKHSDFTEKLRRAGFSPLPLSRIGYAPSTKDANIFTVGYPATPSFLDDAHMGMTEKLWKSGLIAVPAFEFGKVTDLPVGETYFLCNLNVHTGYSGGPIIEGDHVVGIILSQQNPDGQKNPYIKAANARYIRELLERQIQKDLSAAEQNDTS